MELNLMLLEQLFWCTDSVVNVCVPSKKQGLRESASDRFSPRSLHEKVSHSLRRSFSKCNRRLRRPQTSARHDSFSDFCRLWRKEIQEAGYRSYVPAVCCPLRHHRLHYSSTEALRSEPHSVKHSDPVCP